MRESPNSAARVSKPDNAATGDDPVQRGSHRALPPYRCMRLCKNHNPLGEPSQVAAE